MDDGAKLMVLRNLRSNSHHPRSGEHGFILSTAWVRQMVNYLTTHGVGVASPGPITNKEIFHDLIQYGLRREIKAMLRDHYVIVSKEQWKQLTEEFGLQDKRQIIPIAEFSFSSVAPTTLLSIDGVCVEIRRYTRDQGFVSEDMVIPPGLTIAQLEWNVRRLYGMRGDVSCRMWLWDDMAESYYQLLCYNHILQDYTSSHNVVVFFDILNYRRRGSDVWSIHLLDPREEASFTAPTRDSCGVFHQPRILPVRSFNSSEDFFGIKTPGICGLFNRQGISYINACVQVLSSVEPLVDFFLNNEIRSDGVIENLEERLIYEVIDEFATFIHLKWHGRDLWTFSDRLAELTAQGNTDPNIYGSIAMVGRFFDGLVNAISSGLRLWQDQERARVNGIAGENPSIDTDLFLGKEGLRRRCLSCRRVSTKFEKSINIYVEWGKEKKLEKILKLQYRSYIRRRYCTRCKRLRRTRWERGYVVLPKFLVIHTIQCKGSVMNTLEYPLRGLRLRNFGGTRRHSYELLAMVVCKVESEVIYSGKPFDYAIAVAKTNGSWYQFYDECVYKEDQIELMCSVMHPRVLLYKLVPE